MGEHNDPVDYPTAMSNLLEALAHYLYDHYETNPHPMRDDDPRNTSLGCVEPWNTAGKRMREKWFEEADQLIKHFAQLYSDM